MLFEEVKSVEQLQRLLPTLALMTKAIANLANASQSVKKYAAEVEEKTRLVAAEAAKEARSQGLSEESANQIRAMILGIAV